MIIRERSEEIVMIGQHEHGQISGHFADRWQTGDLAGSLREAVVFAAYEHDRCWLDLDDIPIWNDADKAPYTFIDYPIRPKLLAYGKGIDEIRQRNGYSGLLASLHFSALLEPFDHPAISAYLEERRLLEQRWKAELGLDDDKRRELDGHLRILQFCDHLSLYVCMNEPGADKSEEMPWYISGIPESSMLPPSGGTAIVPRWLDASTIAVGAFPFQTPFRIELRGKTVAKADIERRGLAHAYENAALETWPIDIVPG